MGFLPVFFLLITIWNPSSEGQEGIDDLVLFMGEIKSWSPGFRREVDLVVISKGWEKDLPCSQGSSLFEGARGVSLGGEEIGGWFKSKMGTLTSLGESKGVFSMVLGTEEAVGVGIRVC